ncbi:nuclear transport factor 2 family protein [Enterobacterales bacterium AE_CKDN230030158-1A_HGKHYDSX7]
MSAFLQAFARSFAQLDRETLDRLEQLYTSDIEFIDPLHELHGLPRVRDYFAQLYVNARDIRYDFHGFDEVAPGQGYLRWTLSFRHPRLNGGETIHTSGCSHLCWNERVYRHRDYYDAGALLYEHLPLMGRVIAWLKRRLA